LTGKLLQNLLVAHQNVNHKQSRMIVIRLFMIAFGILRLTESDFGHIVSQVWEDFMNATQQGYLAGCSDRARVCDFRQGEFKQGGGHDGRS